MTFLLTITWKTMFFNQELKIDVLHLSLLHLKHTTLSAKKQSLEICFTCIFADNGSFDSDPAFSHTTLGAVRHNRGFSRTAKSVILGRKIARFYQKF